MENITDYYTFSFVIQQSLFKYNPLEYSNWKSREAGKHVADELNW